MIANAPWTRREYHTSVIDATGAIYVIGGDCNDGVCNDVWASTDKGADRARAATGGVLGD